MGPTALLAGLVVLTSVFSQVISNTATTVLVAPLAIATSAVFSTPVASPVNTLVLGPGAYRFKDFLKVGVSLQGLVIALTVVIVPLLFPFQD